MISQSKPRYKKTFTPELKEQYKQKKEAEKLELQALYEQFLAKKTIQDFIGIIANCKQTHKYSIRNLCLVLAQAEKRGDKKLVGVLNSFQNWRKQDISILKGSKAYKVIVPIFHRKSEETNIIKSEDGEADKVLSYFKTGNTFDVSQTTEYENYLLEQKEIDEKIMKNHEINYQTALDYVKQDYPNVSIIEDFKHQDKKGSYDPLTPEITLYEQSSHTVFHELGHHITISILKIAGDIRKDYAKNEILAEITAYLLMKSFDENIQYNFAYSNIWASRITDTFELDEFERVFKSITHYIQKAEISKQAYTKRSLYNFYPNQ